MSKVSGLEAVARDYRPKGVKFYFIYKALAHPSYQGYVAPYTLEERLAHAREARRRLGTSIPWLVDAMDNRLKHALGDAPNSEFVFNPEGKLARVRQWSNPQALRKDLEELVGPVEKITRPEDLKLPRPAPPQAAKRGVVPRLEVPRGMQPLKVEPQLAASAEPFYMKLRAEAEPELLRSGRGRLYLGFYPDPIYGVHWNNLTPPPQIVLEAPKGMKLSPTRLQGPKVKEPADIDPREFLVEVQKAPRGKAPLRVKISYFACNDQAGWCKRLEQEYLVYLQRDADGGRRLGTRGGPLAGRGPGPRGPFGPPRAMFRNAIRGVVLQVDLKQRRLQLRSPGGVRTVEVATDARIVKNGRPAELKDIRRGDRVLALPRPEQSGKDDSPAEGQNIPRVIRLRARSAPGR